MLAYLIRRIVQTIPVLLVTSLIVFTVLRMIPGDPARNMAGENATPEDIAAITARLGLDKPLPQQYLIYLGNVVQGDFGSSYVSNRSVLSLVGDAAPATLQLSTAAFALSLAVGIPFGVIAGLKPNSVWDFALAGYTAVMQGFPNFLQAIIYLLLFAVILGWLPAGGRGDLTDDPIDAIKRMTLPVITLALPIAAIYARFLRTAVIETFTQDYVRTARAKGLASSTVVLRHVLRNALLPLVAIVGIQFSRMLGGTVITESIFAWPGMGRLALNAINGRDYELFQGIMLLLVVGAVFVNFLVELSYGFLDPRIRR